MIKILLGLGALSALVLEAYALLPGESKPVAEQETVPAKKVSHKEISKVSHKETPKIGHKETAEHFHPKNPKTELASPLDKETAHDLSRFISGFLSACCSRNSDRDQRQFFAGHAEYLGNGKLSRTAIEAKMMRFDSFWPKRKYVAKGKPVIAGLDGDRSGENTSQGSNYCGGTGGIGPSGVTGAKTPLAAGADE